MAIPPTAATGAMSAPRFVYGLIYGVGASMLIWAMIAGAVYELT